MTIYQAAPVAQLAERLAFNQKVAGSIPAWSPYSFFIPAYCFHLVRLGLVNQSFVF
jgi:hypothetical protein